MIVGKFLHILQGVGGAFSVNRFEVKLNSTDHNWGIWG